MQTAESTRLKTSQVLESPKYMPQPLSGGLGEFVRDDGVEVQEADHRLLERDDTAAEGALALRNDFRRRGARSRLRR